MFLVHVTGPNDVLSEVGVPANSLQTVTDYNQLKESSPKKKHKTEWGGNEVEKDKKEEDTRICLANTASDWWNWLSPIKVSEEPGSFYLVCFTFYADETKEEAPTNKKLAQAKT